MLSIIIDTLVKVPSDELYTIYIIQEEISILVEKNVLMHILYIDLDRSIDSILIPLLKSFAENGVAWNIFRTCAERDVANCVGVGVAFYQFNFSDFLKALSDRLIVRVLLNVKDSAEKQKLLEALLKVGVTFPADFLINDTSMIPYYLLLSHNVYKNTDLLGLMTSELEQTFSQGASSLGVPVITQQNHGMYYQAAYHNLQLQLVWDLGSPDPIYTEKIKFALQALSAMGEVFILKKEVTATEDFIVLVEENLPRHFLFIMRNLLQTHEWATENIFSQLNSFRSLKHLISLLKESDLVKFLPKVLSFHYYSSSIQRITL